MPDKIYLRGGLASQRPTLGEREPSFDTDSKEVWIGSNSGNVRIHAPYTKTSYFRAVPSGVQSLSAATFTKIGYSSKSLDYLSEYDAPNSNYIVSRSGLFLLNASIMFAATNPDGNTGLMYFAVNGVEYGRVYNSSMGKANDTNLIAGTTIAKLTAGDVVSVYAYTANALSTVATSTYSYFTCIQLAE